MDLVRIKGGIGYLLYVVILIALLYWGSVYLDRIKTLVALNYNPEFHFTATSILLIFIGMYIALPGLIKRISRPGTWTIDWVRLIITGLPTLYVAFWPLIYFVPPFQFLHLEFTRILTMYSLLPQTVCGIVFGYTLLSSINKKTTGEVISDTGIISKGL